MHSDEGHFSHPQVMGHVNLELLANMGEAMLGERRPRCPGQRRCLVCEHSGALRMKRQTRNLPQDSLIARSFLHFFKSTHGQRQTVSQPSLLDLSIDSTSIMDFTMAIWAQRLCVRYAIGPPF